jgi:serine/threonine-protein kinase
MPRPGDLVGGKYRVVRVIGEGGMGTVYEARHEHLGSSVALKFLHPDLAQRPPLVARFLQEARVSATIKSPYVTQVVDVDQTAEGAPYLVMELLEGESLDSRMARGMPLPLALALDIGLQILLALEAAHAHGVVHRDLKPDNVWLGPPATSPHVKLLDFGIAKLKSSQEFLQVATRPGSMMGTPAYMAPEQAISADQVDHRADLYSFGVILYEMLSGSRPVDTDDANEMLVRLARGEVHPLATKNPDVPRGVAELVDRLVAPNPDRRPPSAAAAHAELSRQVMAPASSRGTVSATLPPDDGRPAASVGAAATGRVITDSMPEMPSTTAAFASAPTALQTHPAVPPPRGAPVAAIFGIVLVLLLGGASLWAYMNPSIFDRSPAPPLPGPAPSTPPPLRALDAVVADDRVAPHPARRASPVSPRAGAGAPAGSGAGSSAGPVTRPPPLPFPPFPIPSGLIPMPSVLPPFLARLPELAPTLLRGASAPSAESPPPAAPPPAPSP